VREPQASTRADDHLLVGGGGRPAGGADAARVNSPPQPVGAPAMNISVAYVNVFVSDFGRSVDFFQNTIGLPLTRRDDDFHYASFATDGATFAVVQTDDAALIGRHTGVGLAVDDLDAAYAELGDRVDFPMAPTRQPWGGYMAMLADPDGNQFYFDQVNVNSH
jgi:lactoylglutathione lyase